MLPGMELMDCPDLAVPREVMRHVVQVESSFNPYAIGVVGGRLVRQPRNLPEALSTVRMLEERGYNFSVGLAQVNRYNLAKYGLDSYEKAFQPCANLQAGSRILRECYGRSGGDWGKSFSCYYSGDFRTGYRHGYVQKVYASMRRAAAGGPDVAPIAVVDRTQRRVAATSVQHGRATLDAVAGLLERRAASTSRPAPAPDSHGTPSAEVAADAPTRGNPPPAVAAAAGGVDAAVPAPSQAASIPAASRRPGPVAVTATRLGAAPAPVAAPAVHPPLPSSQQDGADGAFVF